jgi:outer membrane protein TolC
MHRKDVRRRWPWWTLCSILLAGCSSVRTTEYLQITPTPAEGHVELAQHRPFRPGTHEGMPPAPASAEAAKPVPICLDVVFRMAEHQNGQVQVARLKVEEAFNDQELARKHWLPDLSVGMSTWRHEGGIQDFYGNLVKSSYGGDFAGLELSGKYDWKETLFRRVEAERRYWQQQGELSKLTNENLLDASSTYIDLLASRTGIAISLETEVRLNNLLRQAEAMAKIDPGLNVEVSRINSELAAQNVLTVKLREASTGASAKLAYLLGLNPCCELMAMDQLVPLGLVDASQDVQSFVTQVLSKGPGVRELEGLLRTVETARNSNYGWQHWVPAICVDMQEGAFGAGSGSQLDWANRMDLQVRLRWNLNEFLYAKQKRQQAAMHIQQVQLSYEDLRMKLTLGVQEARESILSGTERVRLAEKHITHSEESYRLSDQRLKQNIKGRSSSEVLLALRSLGGAQLEYLQAVRDLNKAQLRLYTLVGPVTSHPAP